jgi:hypothetical protein
MGPPVVLTCRHVKTTCTTLHSRGHGRPLMYFWIIAVVMIYVCLSARVDLILWLNVNRSLFCVPLAFASVQLDLLKSAYNDVF